VANVTVTLQFPDDPDFGSAHGTYTPRAAYGSKPAWEKLGGDYDWYLYWQSGYGWILHALVPGTGGPFYSYWYRNATTVPGVYTASGNYAGTATISGPQVHNEGTLTVVASGDTGLTVEDSGDEFGEGTLTVTGAGEVSLASESYTHTPGEFAEGTLTVSASGTAEVVNESFRYGSPISAVQVYQTYWRGDEKLQSAWARFLADTAERVVDIAVVDTDCWLLVENDHGTYFTKIPLTPPDADTSMPYDVHLDNLQQVVGVNADGFTTWTYGLDDETLDCVVLGADFGADAGLYWTTDDDLVRVGNNALKVADAEGVYDGLPCYIGRRYAMSVQLTQPYARDADGNAVFGDLPRVRQVLLQHQTTGRYTVTVQQSARNDRHMNFIPRQQALLNTGRFQVFPMSHADRSTITISSNEPTPVIISGGEFIVEQRVRR
jgi:hypothetical protein